VPAMTNHRRDPGTSRKGAKKEKGQNHQKRKGLAQGHLQGRSVNGHGHQLGDKGQGHPENPQGHQGDQGHQEDGNFYKSVMNM